PAVVVAHRMLGLCWTSLGELEQARKQLEQAVAVYTPAEHRPLTWLYGQEPGMAGRLLLTWALWSLGFADQALQRSREAFDLIREVPHPHSHAYSLCYAAFHHQYRREPQQVRELADAAVALAQDEGLRMWLATATVLRGWAKAEQGEPAEG